MAHSISPKNTEKHLICTTPDMKTLLVYAYDPQERETKTVLREKFEDKISNVIPMDFDATGNISYLISFKFEKGFKNIILFSYLGIKENLDNSNSIPFIFCHMDSVPSILIQIGTPVQSYILKFYNKNGLKKNKIDISIPYIHPQHTSGFIDVTGDMIANLVLETWDGKNRGLAILKYSAPDYKILQEIKLPNEIGPIVFGDFRGRNLVDIAFISKEDEKYFLNILENTGNESKIYISDKLQALDLTNIVENYKPILRNNYTGMGSGLSSVDIYSNSIQHLVLSIGKIGTNKIAYLLLKNDGNGKFKVRKTILKGLSNVAAISASFSNLKNSGNQDLMLNYLENGEFKIDYFQNNSRKSDSYFISSIAQNGDKDSSNLSSAIPGVVYKFNFIEESKIRKIYQFPQSSYPHLSEQCSYLGIGHLATLLEVKEVGIPGIKGEGVVFKTNQKLIPNSHILIKYIDKRLKISLDMNLKTKAWKILLIFSTIALVNIIICVVIRFASNSKYKELQNQNNVRMFNFASL